MPDKAEVTVLHPVTRTDVETFERVLRARSFLDDREQDAIVQDALCSWAHTQLEDDDLAALVEVLEQRELADDS